MGGSLMNSQAVVVAESRLNMAEKSHEREAV